MFIVDTALALLLSLSVAQAEGVRLVEKLEVGNQIHHKIQLAVNGKMQLEKGDQPLTGQAQLQFPERILMVGPDGMAYKVIRHYAGARARFSVAGAEEEERNLRAAIRTVIGQHENGIFAVWSPGGQLTGDERELIEDVIDTTRLPGLLPKTAVKVGSNWKVEPLVAQGLCNLEALIGCELQAAVSELTDDKATIRLVGSVHGISLGAEVKMKIDAIITHDLKQALIEEVVWAQNDARATSPVAPGGSYQARITITRSRSESPLLSDKAMTGMSLEPAKNSKLLRFEGPNGAYRFSYDRDWHVTSVQSAAVILRRMKNNEFVAQMSVSVLAEKATAQRVKPDEFQKMIETVAGWKLDEIIRTDNVPTEGNFQMQRIDAYGNAGKTRLSQRHFLATATDGRQILFSFLMEPASEPKFADADVKLVGTLEMPTTTERTADNGAKSNLKR